MAFIASRSGPAWAAALLRRRRGATSAGFSLEHLMPVKTYEIEHDLTQEHVLERRQSALVILSSKAFECFEEVRISESQLKQLLGQKHARSLVVVLVGI